MNIPILAWLFVPLMLLGETESGWAFLALGVAATASTCALLVRVARPETSARLVIVLLFLLNGPLVNSLREGNTTHFILLMLVGALLLWRSGNEFMAGLLLGLCAIIKLPLMLYGIYFILRGRWRIVAGGATTIGSLALVSLAVFGMRSNIAWFDCCVEPFIGGILPAFNVQSFDGFVIRLITGASQLAVWEPIDLPAAYRAVRALLFAGDIRRRSAHLGQVWPQAVLCAATASSVRRSGIRPCSQSGSGHESDFVDALLSADAAAVEPLPRGAAAIAERCRHAASRLGQHRARAHCR